MGARLGNQIVLAARRAVHATIPGDPKLVGPRLDEGDVGREVRLRTLATFGDEIPPELVEALATDDLLCPNRFACPSKTSKVTEALPEGRQNNRAV